MTPETPLAASDMIAAGGVSVAAVTTDVVPRPPVKSVSAWLLDVLIWGGIAVVLIYSIGDVDLGNLGKLFSNSENIQTFARDLLRPDFENWRLFVAQMWQTIQIALWAPSSPSSWRYRWASRPRATSRRPGW